MPKADGSIIIDTRIDTKGFQSGSVNLQSQFSKLAGAAKKLSLALGSAFALGKIVQFGKEAIELGSDLQEVQNVVDVTFGSLSSQIDEFAKNAITSFGLSELSAKQYASTIGAMLKSMGFATDQAAAMSMEIAGLAGDMASFYNLTGDDAFAKIRSGISGETEPLKQLGINLSVANLEQYALAQGITKTYNAMTEQEKALLRYNYLLSVTSDAQDDFARTSNSWANQTKILSEQFNSLKATIGQGLINVLTPVIKVINTILSGLQAIANAFRQFTELLFGAAGGTAGQIEDVAAGFESAAGGASDLAAGTEKAGKAAKKYLAGFDEITKLGGDGGSGGSGGGGGGVGSVDFGGINLGGTEPVQDNISPQIQAIVDKVHSLLEPLKEIDFSPLRESLQNLGGAFSDLGATIADSLGWGWDNILLPLAGWTIEAGAPESIGLLTDGLDLLSSVLGPVCDGLDKFWGYLKPVFQFIGDTVLEIIGWFREAFQTLSDVFEEKGPLISDAIENIGEVFGIIWSGIEPVLKDLRDLVGEVFLFVVDLAALAAGDIIDAFHGLTEFLAGAFSGDWDRAFAGIIEIVNAFIDFFFDALTAIFDFFGLEFDFEEIKSGFKAMVNSVIGFLNKLIPGVVDGINTAIRAINKISVTIPDWVPGIGGNSIGFNLSTISAPQIPYLARGAVIPPNAPFMAVLGDQSHGTNIEAPLSTIQEAVAIVMEDMLQGQMAGFEAVVDVLREILEAIYGIEIGDEVIANASNRYREKMLIVRGGV